MRTTLTITVLLAAGLAGCLQGQDRTDDPSDPPLVPAFPADWAQRAIPFGDDHDHDDVLHHQNLTTPNFQIIGWDPLITAYHGATSGTYFCGGVAEDGERTIAVTKSFSTNVALVVVDITDPGAPELLGELVLEGTFTYDADIVGNGRYAVVGTNPPREQGERFDALPDAKVPIRAVWRDACGNEHAGQQQEVPYASGVVLVDLADPTQPEVADYAAMPVQGAHSVFATTIDGAHYVLGSIANGVHGVSYFSFFTIEEIPALGPRLVAYGTHTASYPDGETGPGSTLMGNGHIDGWIQKHPKTGQLLAYLANWNGGLIILHLEGPGRLTPIGAWNDYDPAKGTGMTGVVHSTLPLEALWGDRHVTIIGQEVGVRPANRPTGQVIVMDTTDPARPTPVARWTLPADVEAADDRLVWSPLQFSTHYVALVDRTLFVSLYHGGVWAVDTSEEHWPELPSVGVFIPDHVSPNPPPPHLNLFARWSPNVLDVLSLSTGDLVVFDAMSGLYTVRFDASMEAPIPTKWMADAWL